MIGEGGKHCDRANRSPMKRKTVFRDCIRSDLKVLQKLVEELYYTDAGPRADVPEIAFTYRSLSAKPDKGRLIVFERGDKLVGYAILIFFFSSEFGGDIIDIDEILVTEDARGQGVGSAFFEWISKTYKKAVGWSLQVRPGNKRARKLYESFGFLTSANLHLYNIFAWNDRHLLRGESAKKKEFSRKNTTPSKTEPRSVSKKSTAEHRSSAGHAGSKSKPNNKTRAKSTAKTSSSSAKVKSRSLGGRSTKTGSSRAQAAAKSVARKRSR